MSGSKDIVANRSRLRSSHKVKLLWRLLRDNGLVWTSLLMLYYFGSGLAESAFLKLQNLKLKRNLPGTSSLGVNKEVWENWDWQAGGEEWTPDPDWKDSLVRNVLRRYIPQGGHILEIGPGAGRWTAFLLPMADSFTAVDIAESCVRICHQKFGDNPHAEFLVGNGKDLSNLPDQSIDSLWSFDVFVHINIDEAENYVRDLKRVMRPNAVGAIHHGTSGGLAGGWRSNLTSETFGEILRRADFKVLHELRTWEDQGQTYRVGLYNDQVTVFTNASESQEVTQQLGPASTW